MIHIQTVHSELCDKPRYKSRKVQEIHLVL